MHAGTARGGAWTLYMWILSPEFGHTPKKSGIFFLKAVLGVFWSTESIFEVCSCSKKFPWLGRILPCLPVCNCSSRMFNKIHASLMILLPLSHSTPFPRAVGVPASTSVKSLGACAGLIGLVHTCRPCRPRSHKCNFLQAQQAQQVWCYII